MKPGKRTIAVAGIIIGALLVIILLSLYRSGEYSQTSGDAKYSLTAPNGLGFGEIKGYENWQLVASHYRTDNNEIRFIMGNTKVIQAYKDGSGKNGKPFPDGVILVKIGYSVKHNPDFNTSVEPDVLKRVEFIIKDSGRFKDTAGWGYARFVYDPNTTSFKPYGKDQNFVFECFGCHTIVAKKDFVFTDYINR